ncbi:hypothetical protein PCC6311_1629 [Synechococcus elongatus PCC 6311]|uniref:Uncharacterized protein n=2 Tax=Synechococcus elongatus TaxID=32046 RepID=Q31N00_SYNE7|nr:conserved hypothetical protein [Synechococcus elongatus PCC 7942 = FACHB-805]UOW71355.1 hypothetical protein PCC7943_1607 [Synechococcus elongatus PCC 7943]UOW74098.1 hypothetical protein PCC6311_1629 [Synechococcus elongatus PCC 6311]UOW76819.1 hypothetical protein PCC6301pg_1630 [Synechococcus elongatus PCC 6301]BAD80714.1 hypothetical protein syc2524_c [Synechococcus elongatus PCC 6301]
MNQIIINSVCPICIWLVLTLFFLSVLCALQDGAAQLKRLHQVPCNRCAFSTGDHRLKCTVRPCQAFSEEAICCIDFEPVSIKPAHLWLIQSLQVSKLGRS